MLRFLDCFYRHRALLLVMAGTTLLLSVAVVARQPPAYEATARVWVDTSVQGDHPNPYITAADGANLILGELLRTREFCSQVAGRSRLIPGPRPAQGLGGQVYDDSAYQALSTRVVLGAAGPNVIAVTFRHRDPGLAASTTQAVVDLFRQEVVSRQAGSARTTVGFYQKQLTSAEAELSRADARIADYLSNNPDVSQPVSAAPAPIAAGSSAPPDVALAALQRDDDALRKQTDDLIQKLNQAKLDLTAAQQSTPSSIRVIDAPLPPRRPISRTLLLLTTGLGGLLAGGLLSLLVLAALTAADSSLRYPSEVEQALGLRLVGTVPRIA